MKLLDRLLRRKKPGAKNPVFVEAGRRGGIRSGEVPRARAKQRRSMGAEVSPTEPEPAKMEQEEVSDLVKKLLQEVVEEAAPLEAPMEPGPMEPIEATASIQIRAEAAPREEEGEAALEASVLSRLEQALGEAEAEVSRIRRIREKAEVELSRMRVMFQTPPAQDLEGRGERVGGKSRTNAATSLSMRRRR